jgi:hypothetical protein
MPLFVTLSALSGIHGPCTGFSTPAGVATTRTFIFATLEIFILSVLAVMIIDSLSIMSSGARVFVPVIRVHRGCIGLLCLLFGKGSKWVAAPTLLLLRILAISGSWCDHIHIFFLELLLSFLSLLSFLDAL